MQRVTNSAYLYYTLLQFIKNLQGERKRMRRLAAFTGIRWQNRKRTKKGIEEAASTVSPNTLSLYHS